MKKLHKTSPILALALAAITGSTGVSQASVTPVVEIGGVKSIIRAQQSAPVTLFGTVQAPVEQQFAHNSSSSNSRVRYNSNSSSNSRFNRAANWRGYNSANSSSNNSYNRRSNNSSSARSRGSSNSS